MYLPSSTLGNLITYILLMETMKKHSVISAVFAPDIFFT